MKVESTGAIKKACEREHFNKIKQGLAINCPKCNNYYTVGEVLYLNLNQEDCSIGYFNLNKEFNNLS